MKLSSFTLSLPLLAVLLFVTSCNAPVAENNYMVVGYVAGFRDYDFSKIDARKLTHINYAFANIIDGRVMFGEDLTDDTQRNIDDINTLTDLREVNPDLKILVSVGGWGWSGNFSDAALTDSTRERFARSAVDFIIEHELDGIDLDWEYPNHPGAGNVYRPDDVHNFTLLLRCLREHLDSLSSEQLRDEGYLLTIATGADSTYVANTELGKVSEYTDFINIMTYDFHSGLTSQAGHNSNLHQSEYDANNGDATDRSVNMHIAAGVPPSKINVGVPFYGRMWKGVEPVKTGLYRQARTTGMSISYKNVINAASEPGFEMMYDSSAAAPYLWNEKDSVFITYDNEASLAEKMKYVKSAGLGGVMFWEYSEDIDGRLLNALIDELKKK